MAQQRGAVEGVGAARAGSGGRLAACLLAAAAILIYANALPNEFAFDDKHLIVGNEVIRDARNLPEILTGNLWASVPGRASNFYRPIPALALMTTYNLAGPRPWVFRLLNLLLHAGTTLLVFVTAARLLAERGEPRTYAVGSGAFLAALLFAVHPMHVEGVAWVSGIMDVGSACFGLLALALYVGADRSRATGARYWGAVFAYFLSMLVKEPGLSVLPVIVVFDLTWPGVPRRTRVGALRRWGPFAGAAVVYLLLRIHALRGIAPFELLEPLDPVATILTAPFLFAVYLAKLVVPARLTAMPDIAPVTSLVDLRAWIGVGVVVAAMVVAWWAYRRDRLAWLGLTVLVLTLLPALYLPALGRELRHAFAERYAYFSSTGLALVAAAALTLLLRHRLSRRPVLVLVTLLAMAYAGGTLARNRVWRDDLTLWTDAEAKAHGSAVIYQNLGFALIFENRPEEGAAMLRRAHELKPELDDQLISRGILHARGGRLMEAVLSFQAVLTFEPNSAVAHYNLGWAYDRLGWRDAAIAEYRLAVAIFPDYADAHSNLGVALAEAGRLDEALGHFERAAAVAPDNPSHRQNLERARRRLARRPD
jgi:tetratricopeptide (TPR) repeat protein